MQSTLSGFQYYHIFNKYCNARPGHTAVSRAHGYKLFQIGMQASARDPAYLLLGVLESHAFISERQSLVSNSLIGRLICLIGGLINLIGGIISPMGGLISVISGPTNLISGSIILIGGQLVYLPG